MGGELLLFELHGDHGHVAAGEDAEDGAGDAVLLAEDDVLIGWDVDVDGFAGFDGGGPGDLEEDAAAAHVAGVGGDEASGGGVEELDWARGEDARAAALIAGATGGDGLEREEVRAHGRALSLRVCVQLWRCGVRRFVAPTSIGGRVRALSRLFLITHQIARWNASIVLAMDISVIIPASAWQPGIAVTLERLARQQFAADRYEVLLACPLTTEHATAAELAWTRAGGSRGHALRFVQPTLTAPGTWMHYANAALGTAGGRIAMLLQPGLLPEPHVLAAHVQSHGGLAGSGVSCVTGRVLAPATEKATLWHAMLARWCSSLRRADRPEGDPRDAMHCSISSDALRRVGAFTCFATGQTHALADLVCKLRARTGVTMLEQPEAKAWLEDLGSPLQTITRDYQLGWSSVHTWFTSNCWRSAWHPAQLDDDDAVTHLRRAIENDSVVCEKMLTWFLALATRPSPVDAALTDELAHDAWERALTLRRWAYRRGTLAALEMAGDRPAVYVSCPQVPFLSGLALAA